MMRNYDSKLYMNTVLLFDDVESSTYSKKAHRVGYILNFFKFYLIWKLSLSSFPFSDAYLTSILLP